jgi:hypothetical protein
MTTVNKTPKASGKAELPKTYYECGICGAYHRWEFNGDCRQDSERFNDVPDNADLRSWADRVEADELTEPKGFI